MTTISSGQTIFVQYGQSVSGDSVLVGGDLTVEFGAVSTDTLLDGGKESLTGVASGTIVESGGVIAVSSGAVGSYTVLLAGGTEYLRGSAIGTSVGSGGIDKIYAGGYDYGSVVGSGGAEYVSSGGTADDTAISQGGVIYVDDDGLTEYCVIYGGRGVVYNGGSAEIVVDGGSDGGGTLLVSSGGKSLYSEVGNDQSRFNSYIKILSGGAATSTFISAYGELFISSGGVASDTVLSSGSLYVYRGGTAASVTVLGEPFISTAALL